MPEYRDRDGFSGRYASGLPFAVWARMDGDLLTAVAAFMKLRAARSGPAFMLESVEGGAVRGRYSMIGVAPDLIWRVRDGRAEINRDALARPDAFAPEPDPPLPSLRRLVSETSFELDEGLPPMSAGLFGYLGYDMVRQMERLGRPSPSPIGAPEAVMVRPTAMIVFDNLRDEISIIHTVRPETGTEEDVAYDAAMALIAELIACLEAPLTISPLPRPSSGIGAPVSNMGAGD